MRARHPNRILHFRRPWWLIVSLVVLFAASVTNGADANSGTVQHDFRRDVVPFLNQFCLDCHSGDDAEAKLRFDKFQEQSNVQQEFLLWEKVQRAVRDRKMPPGDALQPTEDERLRGTNAIATELSRFDCRLASRPGRVTIRRLNRAEYDRTVQDLFGVDIQPARAFPTDDVGHGFDNIADVLSIPPILLEKYLEAAEAVVDQVFANEEARGRLFVHQPRTEEEKVDAFRKNMFQFAERAFRRPLTESDQLGLFRLAESAFTNGVSEENIAKTVCTAILVSPHFLFRVEDDPAPDDEDGVRDLSDWELASRLSYFLWSTMPDDELFALARAGTLSEPDELRRQVVRMLQSPKSRALVDNFAGQWLQLRDVATRMPDPGRFPDFDDELRQAIRRETELVFATVVHENRSIVDFLEADYTFANERLAKHYGIDGVVGPEFQRVSLPPSRRGVLTHASVLLVTSNPTRTSPVKRGKWILENILGEPPPLPPPNVPELKDDADALGTLRERMQQHRENPACASCHEQMDTLGFGMENFDAIGAWRDLDGPAPIDPTGNLPDGSTFAGASDLAKLLANGKKEAFARCLTEKLLIYALGRGIEPFDRCAVNEILKQLEGDAYRFQTLVTGIVLSEPFLKRESSRTK